MKYELTFHMSGINIPYVWNISLKLNNINLFKKKLRIFEELFLLNT